MFDWLSPKVRPQVALVIKLILNNDGWIKQHATWWHPSGVCVWTENRWYGTDIRFGSTGLHDYACNGDGAGVGLTKREKAEVGKAVEAVEALDKALLAKAQYIKSRIDLLQVTRRIAEMYGT